LEGFRRPFGGALEPLGGEFFPTQRKGFGFRKTGQAPNFPQRGSRGGPFGDKYPGVNWGGEKGAPLERVWPLKRGLLERKRVELAQFLRQKEGRAFKRSIFGGISHQHK